MDIAWEFLEFMAIILAIIYPVGVTIIWYLERCAHTWDHIDDFEIKKPINGADKVVGITRVYQCTHCKKIKGESFKL